MEVIIGVIWKWLGAITLIGSLLATFLGIPITIIIYFIVRLCKFLKKNKQNKINPGTFTEEIIKREKIEVIIFGVSSAGSLIFIINLINMLNRPITFM